MLLFPPADAVAVIVNGHPVAAYARPFARDGRVFAPIRPFITRLADRLWFEGRVLVIVRGGRVARVRLAAARGAALGEAYVAIAPLLRALGERVWYDARRRAVEIVTPQAGAIALPSPFDPFSREVTPRAIFTPTIPPTPRPIWTGVPEPRRTPIPITTLLPPVGGRGG